MGRETVANTDSLTDSDSLVGSARLFLHLKENNIQYLIGILIAYQMGLLDKLYETGVGLC